MPISSADSKLLKIICFFIQFYCLIINTLHYSFICDKIRNCRVPICRQIGRPFLKRLGYASDVTVTGPAGLGSDKEEAAKGVVIVITHVARIGMPLAELVDLEKEKARLAKELKKNKGELEKLTNKLSNPGFLNKAPENVVKAEQERAEKLAALITKLEEQAASL